MARRDSGRSCPFTALAAVLAAKALLPGLITPPVTAKRDRRRPLGLHPFAARTGLRLAGDTWSRRCRSHADTRSRRCRTHADTRSRRCRSRADTRSRLCRSLADTRGRRHLPLADTLSRRFRPLVHNTTAFTPAIAVCVGVPSAAIRPSSGPGLCRSAPPRFAHASIPVGVRTTGS